MGSRGNFALRAGMIYSISPTLVAADSEDTLLGGTSLVVTEDGVIDYADLEAKARQHKPKLILAGYSAYSRVLDFARFRAIADAV